MTDFGQTPGGYVYRIRTAFADRVAGVYPINRGAGRVELRILARAGDGTADSTLISDIVAAFDNDYSGQCTDVVTVLPADIVTVTPAVTLFLPSGPDRTSIGIKATAALAALGATLHRINAPVYREAISTAAHVGGVVTVRVDTPVSDIAARPEAAPFFLPAVVNFSIL